MYYSLILTYIFDVFTIFYIYFLSIIILYFNSGSENNFWCAINCSFFITFSFQSIEIFKRPSMKIAVDLNWEIKNMQTHCIFILCWIFLKNRKHFSFVKSKAIFTTVYIQNYIHILQSFIMKKYNFQIFKYVIKNCSQYKCLINIYGNYKIKCSANSWLLSKSETFLKTFISIYNISVIDTWERCEVSSMRVKIVERNSFEYYRSAIAIFNLHKQRISVMSC